MDVTIFAKFSKVLNAIM